MATTPITQPYANETLDGSMMLIRWQLYPNADGNVMAKRWQSGGIAMATRWQYDGHTMAIRRRRDGDVMAAVALWQSLQAQVIRLRTQANDCM